MEFVPDPLQRNLVCPDCHHSTEFLISRDDLPPVRALCIDADHGLTFPDSVNAAQYRDGEFVVLCRNCRWSIGVVSEQHLLDTLTANQP